MYVISAVKNSPRRKVEVPTGVFTNKKQGGLAPTFIEVI